MMGMFFVAPVLRKSNLDAAMSSLSQILVNQAKLVAVRMTRENKKQHHLF